MTLLMREQEKYKESKIEGKIEGKAVGIIEFALDLVYTNEEILVILQKKLGINASQAEKYLERFHEGTL